MFFEEGPFQKSSREYIYCHGCHHPIKLLLLGETLILSCTELCCACTCEVPKERFNLFDRGCFRRALRYMLHIRQEGKCWICTNPIDPENGTLDHVIPLCEGGKTELGNFKLAHSTCNTRRMVYDRIDGKWVRKKHARVA